MSGVSVGKEKEGGEKREGKRMEILLKGALAVVLVIIGFLYALASGKLEKKARTERTIKEVAAGQKRDKWNTFRRFEDVYSSIEEVQGLFIT